MREFWTIEQLRAFTDPKVDRRKFLKGFAGLAGGAMIGPYLGGTAHAAAGGHLNIMVWEGFSLENELKAWREKHGVTTNVSIISIQDDVQNKLIGSNPLPLDVAEYNQAYDRFYVDELKIVKPIDVSQIPNYNEKDTFPGFYKGNRWFWDGNQWGIPWIWGLNSLIYNPKIIPEPKSMKDLLSPELKGKLTFVDDITGTWPMIARVGGFGDKFPNLTVDELRAAFEAVKPYREQCKVFAASNGDVISLFASGEIGACFNAWSGIPFEVAKQNIELKYTIPEEGAIMWCDAWFIPISATNVETANAFMNESLDAKAQAAVCKAVIGGSVQKTAIAEMDPETKALFDYDNLDEVFKKAPLLGIPPRESDQYATYDKWVELWTEFKAGF